MTKSQPGLQVLRVEGIDAMSSTRLREEARALCADVDASLLAKKCATQERLANDRARMAAVLVLVKRENQELADWSAREKSGPLGANCGEPRAVDGRWTSASLEHAIEHTKEIAISKPVSKQRKRCHWTEAYTYSVRKRALPAEHCDLSIEHLQKAIRKDRKDASLYYTVGLRHWDNLRLQDAAQWFMRAVACAESNRELNSPVVINNSLHLNFEAHLALGYEQRESLVKSSNFSIAAQAMESWLDVGAWSKEQLQEADDTLCLVEEALRPFRYEDQEVILRSGSLGSLGDLHVRILYRRIEYGGSATDTCKQRLGELLAERREFAQACKVLYDASSADRVQHPRLPAQALRTYEPWNEVTSYAYDRFDAVPAHRERRRRRERHKSRSLLCAGPGDRDRLKQEHSNRERYRAFESRVIAHHHNNRDTTSLESKTTSGDLGLFCVARETLRNDDDTACACANEAQGMFKEEVRSHASRVALAREHETPALESSTFP
ncbi:Hypothetical Protein FCC1311_003492 [Hondaea fermentalgiana]|uniref:Uncharacterized protein n=1 Tax=Hondaea fermentalgiana TaxID=2315210 RepID=A0A2R5G7X2_9STRA|nr:Hypothetical Protein FCC1311_003492 [Hondaea fermentalgiana]|eukprot:GBG24131.1 Hypothetical Protein FCC1311_003492 [Hondaea fermentalgiana]